MGDEQPLSEKELIKPIINEANSDKDDNNMSFEPKKDNDLDDIGNMQNRDGAQSMFVGTTNGIKGLIGNSLASKMKLIQS